MTMNKTFRDVGLIAAGAVSAGLLWHAFGAATAAYQIEGAHDADGKQVYPKPK